MTSSEETREPYPDREPPPQPSREKLSGPDVDHLLVSAGHGDVGALSDFYDITAPAVFGLLRGVQFSPEMAEQATERIYLRIWRAAPQFAPDDDTAYSLLMRAARHEVAQWLTRRLPQGVHSQSSDQISKA